MDETVKFKPVKGEEFEFITLEELYQDYHIIPEYEEGKDCYYLEDPDTDEAFTPCFYDIYDLIRWLNENWDEVEERMERIKEKIVEPDET